MANDERALRVDTSTNAPTPPSIAAAFLVIFDHRKGYVLGWHKSNDDVSVEGAVELKSLPSGLHNVEEDLVYFVHEDYVGVSAYVNKQDASAARNATMLAVGILVPLQQGRMGKGWLHAEGLKAVARRMIENKDDTSSLETYWDQYRINETQASAAPDESTDSLFISKNNSQANGGYQKFRSMSASTTFPLGMHTLAPHHPAATLLESFDIFGPLIFPLYRAALLRKRILILTEAPVEFANNIVYNLSILSAVPRALLQFLAADITPSSLRRRPLFTVGIIDIPTLSLPASDGWIACTTDDVLVTKPECFDVLVFLPSADSRRARRKVYPRIVMSSPDLSRNFPRHGVKATQRDADRYTILREGIRPFPASIVEQPIIEPHDTSTYHEQATAIDETVDTASTISTTSSTSTLRNRRDLIEPASWSQVAYTSLLWWASAGDRRVGLTETEELERDMDLALLDPGSVDEDQDERTKEIVVLSFFRRLTGVLFEGVSGVIWGDEGEYNDQAEEVERDIQNHDEDQVSGGDVEALVPSEGEGEGGEDQQPLLSGQSKQHTSSTATDDDEEPIPFTSEDISSLSLDPWSASDRKFVKEFVNVWWGRKTRIRGVGVECCGVKLL
jgi:DENN domain-containing protein 11/Domain of unknown function (DUF4484)